MLDTTEAREVADPELDGEDPHLSDEELAHIFADLDALDAEKRATWCVDSLDAADFALRRLGELAEEIETTNRIAQANLDRIQARRDALNARCQRGVDYFEGKLREYVEAHAAEIFHGKRKSRALVHGHIGLRQKPEGLRVVDPEKLLAWARAQPIEWGVLRVKEEAALSEIKKHLKDAGEVPDGTTLVEAHDEFYVKPISLNGGKDGNED